MYIKYEASFKFAVVRSSLEGLCLDQINLRHGASVSPDSLRRWCKLYETTRAVVCDPATYATRGRPLALNHEERDFLAELVETNPTIYLAEIQQELLEKYDASVSLQTISNELHCRLNLSQKTMRKVHPNQDIDQRVAYTRIMAHMDPNLLVFTGKFFHTNLYIIVFLFKSSQAD